MWNSLWLWHLLLRELVLRSFFVRSELAEGGPRRRGGAGAGAGALRVGRGRPIYCRGARIVIVVKRNIEKRKTWVDAGGAAGADGPHEFLGHLVAPEKSRQLGARLAAQVLLKEGGVPFRDFFVVPQSAGYLVRKRADALAAVQLQHVLEVLVEARYRHPLTIDGERLRQPLYCFFNPGLQCYADARQAGQEELRVLSRLIHGLHHAVVKIQIGRGFN